MAGPGLALLRKKVKEHGTEKHRNVARKIFLQGGWTQKRLFEKGWSDISQCQACQIEEGTEKYRLYHCPEWYEVRREIPEAFRSLEQKARTQDALPHARHPQSLADTLAEGAASGRSARNPRLTNVQCARQKIT